MAFRKINIDRMVSTEKTVLDDTLIILGKNDLSGDIGFLGKKTTNTYSGLVRDQDTASFILIDNITLASETNDIAATNNTLTKGNLELDNLVAESGTITTAPSSDNDIANKKYVDDAIQTIGPAEGAFIVAVGTTATRPETPVAGMIRFNQDTGLFEGYHGDDGWKSFVPATLENDTSLGRPLTPVQGQIWFNTQTLLFEGYNGTSWDVFVPADYQYTP